MFSGLWRRIWKTWKNILISENKPAAAGLFIYNVNSVQEIKKLLPELILRDWSVKTYFRQEIFTGGAS